MIYWNSKTFFIYLTNLCNLHYCGYVGTWSGKILIIRKLRSKEILFISIKNLWFLQFQMSGSFPSPFMHQDTIQSNIPEAIFMPNWFTPDFASDKSWLRPTLDSASNSWLPDKPNICNLMVSVALINLPNFKIMCTHHPSMSSF